MKGLGWQEKGLGLILWQGASIDDILNIRKMTVVP